MNKPIFFDSVSAAVSHIERESGIRFADTIQGVDLTDAQQVMAFLEPQLMNVEQGVYMVRYPMADYAEFVPVDTSGDIWSAGSLFYSGDIAGTPEWFDAIGDDMPYADFSRQQFLNENHMAAIGYKWTTKDLKRGQQLGINPLAEKANGATTSAERFIHKTAMCGDGTKYATGFLNNPLATITTASATIDASTPDETVAIINDALTSVETNTKETYQANTIALATSTYNRLASSRMTDTGMSVLAYIQANSVVPNLVVKKSRHLETLGSGGTKRLIAYANVAEVHKFHLPGGGHQFFPAWQKGPFSWEVPGIMSIGGYDCRIPKAISMVDGV